MLIGRVFSIKVGVVAKGNKKSTFDMVFPGLWIIVAVFCAASNGGESVGTFRYRSGSSHLGIGAHWFSRNSWVTQKVVTFRRFSRLNEFRW